MKKMHTFIDKTLLKFIIVGLINTAFGTAIMFGLYNILHCNYWISSAANYILGSLLSYFLNKYFTFENQERGWKPILRFTVNIIVCYTVAYGVAKPLVAAIMSNFEKNVTENVAMFIGMCLFVCLNYIGQRFFAFKETNSGKQK